MDLPPHVTKAATDAFRDNARLVAMSPTERERAAQYYEQVAQDVKGARAWLAKRYNEERARFLREQVNRIAGTAYDFMMESVKKLLGEEDGDDVSLP